MLDIIFNNSYTLIITYNNTLIITIYGYNENNIIMKVENYKNNYYYLLPTSFKLNQKFFVNNS